MANVGKSSSTKGISKYNFSVKSIKEEEDFSLLSADEIYAKLVSREGLYGKAFFSHKKTKAESRKLNQLWQYAQKHGRNYDIR